MSEVTIAVPVYLEKTMYEVDQLRRSSTGNLGNKTNGANVLPNYLRASIGSCHDLCKYGIRPELVTLERTSKLKGFTTSPNKSLEPAKCEILQKKKSSLNTSKPPSNFGRSTCQIGTNEVESSTTKRIVTAKHPDELKQKPLRTKVSSMSIAQQSSSRNNELNTPKGASNGAVNTGITTSKGIGTSKASKKTYLLPTTSSQSHKSNAKRVQKEGSHLKGSKIIDSLPTTGSQSRKPNALRILKEVSHLKNKRRINKATIQQPSDDDIPEKILYITDMISQNCKYVSSEGNDELCEKQAPIPFLLPDIEAEVEHGGEIVPTQKRSIVPDNQKTRPGKDQSELEDCSLRNLKFREGKRIEIQLEKSSSGRLKLRQGKLLGKNQDQNKNSVAKRKSSTRPEIDGQSYAAMNEANEVVLRRQNPEPKTSMQSLYNNVIKETARKLVQTRKSKVKALVGAFETVISLEDKRTSGTVQT